MVTSKKFVVLVVLLFYLAMVFIITVNFIIDPYFLYRSPIDQLGYLLHMERYQNNGIARYFEYDAIITGTSMAQNFKASQLDDLFDVKSIKTCFAGGSYKEINSHLSRAIFYNSDISMIVRSLDISAINAEKDSLRYSTYPDYLYDENHLNDINYLLNKHTLANGSGRTILNTLIGASITNFDDYRRWQEKYTFSKEVVLSGYSRSEKSNSEIKQILEQDKTRIYENIQQNIVQLADENPNITFYYFLPPYSMVYYDNLNQNNTLEYQLEAIEYAASIIVEQENIKLFSMMDLYDVVTNLDLYKDKTHYSAEINDDILEYMKNEQHLITKQNYVEHFDEVYDFYLNYDYDSIFE